MTGATTEVAPRPVPEGKLTPLPGTQPGLLSAELASAAHLPGGMGWLTPAEERPLGMISL